MFERTVTEAELGHRYIIERPRLTQLLDESNARIILLLAPAGYGKTTLARQWLVSERRRATWFRGVHSKDIATVALGIARAAATVLPGADVRLRNHLTAVPAPEAAVESLAETLATDLLSWPDDLWLVIDDYQLVAQTPAAERFIELLMALAPIRCLVTSRDRPSWLPTRKVIYGEALEVTRNELSLTNSEARDVLRGLTNSDAERIICASQGWPAVVRLAAINGANGTTPDDLPPSLYDYFAEELYRAAPAQIQRDLLSAATLPTLTQPLLDAVLGERAAGMRTAAMKLGFLTTGTNGEADLHPLLGAFLGRKLLETSSGHEIATTVANATIDHERWDDAFFVIQRFSIDGVLPRLFESSLDHLLKLNFVTTLQTWAAYARSHGAEFPLLDLAEAEIASRHGDSRTGEIRAVHAAQRFLQLDVNRAAQAFSVAGLCAHRQMRYAQAHAYYDRAQATTPHPTRRRLAQWGKFVVAIQIESEDAWQQLQAFEELAENTASDVLRAGSGHLILGLLRGSLSAAADECSRLLPLADTADDPFVTTNFLYRLAYTHVVLGDYETALRLAEQTAAVAMTSGLSFVLLHASAARAASEIGLRRFKRAHLQIDHLESEARRIDDRYELLNAAALRIRIQLAMGSADTVERDLHEWPEISQAGLRYECAGLLALALASKKRTREAYLLIDTILSKTQAVQGVTLAYAARVIAALADGSDADQELSNLEAVLSDRGDHDSFVLAYRHYPDLLGRIHERGRLDPLRLERIIRNARDEKLAARFGWVIQRTPRNGSPLSPRELQVFDLIALGLTNREIATKLFISDVTVKVHVRHILEKLGARSRTEAVARFAEVDPSKAG